MGRTLCVVPHAEKNGEGRRDNVCPSLFWLLATPAEALSTVSERGGRRPGVEPLFPHRSFRREGRAVHVVAFEGGEVNPTAGRYPFRRVPYWQSV